MHVWQPLHQTGLNQRRRCLFGFVDELFDSMIEDRAFWQSGFRAGEALLVLLRQTGLPTRAAHGQHVRANGGAINPNSQPIELLPKMSLREQSLTQSRIAIDGELEDGADRY